MVRVSSIALLMKLKSLIAFTFQSVQMWIPSRSVSLPRLASTKSQEFQYVMELANLDFCQTLTETC